MKECKNCVHWEKDDSIMEYYDNNPHWAVCVMGDSSGAYGRGNGPKFDETLMFTDHDEIFGCILTRSDFFCKMYAPAEGN